jgi:hypothetical protein
MKRREKEKREGKCSTRSRRRRAGEGVAHRRGGGDVFVFILLAEETN